MSSVRKIIHEKQDDEGKVVDRYSVCPEVQQSADGYRLVWYHSTRKAELDQAARCCCFSLRSISLTTSSAVRRNGAVE